MFLFFILGLSIKKESAKWIVKRFLKKISEKSHKIDIVSQDSNKITCAYIYFNYIQVKYEYSDLFGYSIALYPIGKHEPLVKPIERTNNIYRLFGMLSYIYRMEKELYEQNNYNGWVNHYTWEFCLSLEGDVYNSLAEQTENMNYKQFSKTFERMLQSELYSIDIVGYSDRSKYFTRKNLHNCFAKNSYQSIPTILRNLFVSIYIAKDFQYLNLKSVFEYLGKYS